ncbi:MAG: response regulator [Patescibacteria group bacterium]
MKKILVLDDDPIFIESIRASLDSARYDFVSAGNGAEGLKIMEKAKPDLILLDIMMPTMDGMEFLKQVNKKYGKGATPIFITSNLSSIEKVSDGVSLGIRGYFVKSNESLQGIIGTIDRVFQK